MQVAAVVPLVVAAVVKFIQVEAGRVVKSVTTCLARIVTIIRKQIQI